MKCPFKVNEFVIVKGYSKDDPNYKARVAAIYPEKEKIWIANYNMPFYGTISEIVPYDAVEKVMKLD